jgi:hypothetical protein
MDRENRTVNSQGGLARCLGRGRQSLKVEMESRFASLLKDLCSMDSTCPNETLNAAGEDAIPVVPVVWNA